MGEKKRRAAGGGGGGGAPTAPFWMVTYSDMVTLLLTFFVLLISMANFEEVGRVEAVFESIRMALGAGGENTLILGKSPDPAQQPQDITQPVDNLIPVQTRLQDALSRHISDDLVKMTRTRTEIRVALSDRVLFQPGSARLHPAAFSLLGDIAKILREYPVIIKVDGHTDDSGNEEGNWELSALRAVAVVSAMQTRGPLDGARLEARGYGEYRPSADALKDPAWDRRVELVIQSEDPAAYDALYKVEQVTDGLVPR
jgi:chemotaxis protein MotB